MLKYNGKEVYVGYQLDIATNTNCWCRPWHYPNHTLFTTSTSIKELIVQNTVVPAAGDTLLFSTSSNYPRFKIQGVFNRCIKLSKAQAVVIGNVAYEEVEYTLIEDSRVAYIVRNFNPNILTKTGIFFGDNPHVVYQGKCCMVPNKIAEETEKILNGTYNKLITDKDLDKIISPKLEDLTPDAINDICTLLDSPDPATRGLGLKLMLGYNVVAHPLICRFILSTRHNLSHLPEWKSKGVSQMLESIYYRGEVSFPGNTWALFRNEVLPQEDIDFVKEKWGEDIKNYVESTISRLKNFPCLKSLNYNLLYELTEL